jgi:peptidoglycan-associated lipoprotein
MNTSLKLFIIPCALALIFCGACKKRVKEAPLAGEDLGGQAALEEPKLEEAGLGTQGFKEITADQAELKAIFRDIPFDYDDFALRPDAKEILNSIAQWLMKNTATQVLIEGHCDERGTIEYNLALGERRSSSAKKYLTQLGVDSERIFTISYGEERPIDSGHTESAWARNRRGHFLLR